MQVAIPFLFWVLLVLLSLLTSPAKNAIKVLNSNSWKIYQVINVKFLSKALFLQWGLASISHNNLSLTKKLAFSIHWLQQGRCPPNVFFTNLNHSLETLGPHTLNFATFKIQVLSTSARKCWGDFRIAQIVSATLL